VTPCNETTPNSEGQVSNQGKSMPPTVPHLSDITGTFDPDSFSVFSPRSRKHPRTDKTALEAAAEYEQSVTNADNDRFASFIESKAHDPEVASWLRTLTPSERTDLGL
jgi:hypothetical protein